MAEKRFMEAVAEKIGKRAPLMRRKGLTGDKKPGMAVMIAIGGPKKSPMPMSRDDEGDDEMPKMSKADKIAALEEKIASLKAELALLEDEDEMEEVEEEAYEQDAEMEDEDED
jgi:hypothetical protein